MDHKRNQHGLAELEGQLRPFTIYGNTCSRDLVFDWSTEWLHSFKVQVQIQQFALYFNACWHVYPLSDHLDTDGSLFTVHPFIRNFAGVNFGAYCLRNTNHEFNVQKFLCLNTQSHC